MLIKSIKCVQADAAMQSLGIPYVVERIKLSDIDKKDLSYQPRRSMSLDQSLVAEYQAAMKRGDTFPMIVVHKRPNAEKFRIVCGRHRAYAMDAVFTGSECELEVMRIDDAHDEQSIYFLATNENTRNGFRQSATEVAISAAEALMKTPLAPSVIQHKPSVIREYAKKAGCSEKTVACEYYSRLATRDFTKAGLEVPVHKTVLEHAWRLRSSAHWPSVMSVVSQYKDVPKLSIILRDVRRDKIAADDVCGEIAIRCEAHAAARGKAVYKRSLRDPVASLIEYLELACQEFESMPASESIVEEKIEDIQACVSMIGKSFRDWRKK